MTRVFYLLKVIKECCYDGLDGEWKCTTKESRDCLSDMIEIIKIIEKELREKEDGKTLE